MKVISIGIAISFTALMVVFAIKAGWESVRTEPTVEKAHVRHLPVATMAIEEVDSYEITNVYSGEIVPRRTSDLGFERGGKLIEVHVREGSEVKRGDPIATLDARRIREQLREVTAAEAEARAVLDELLSGPRPQDLRVGVETVNEVRAQLSYARSNLARVENLYANNVLAKDGIEKAQTEEQRLTAAVSAAEEVLDQLNEGTRPEKIQAQQARVEQLIARKAFLQIEIDDSVLRAPYPGRIARRYADEGTILSTGAPVVRVVQDGSLTAWIGVPNAVAARMIPDARFQ